MFLISACFRPSRSKRSVDRPGVVFYRIAKHGLHERRVERCVNSDIPGADESILQTERDRIISQMRMLYCVIEHRESTGINFTIDDVVSDFRQALAGADAMREIRAKSRTDFPLRQDLVSICRDFRGFFKFIYLPRNNGYEHNLAEFMLDLSRSLKNEERNSLAKNYLSLLASIRLFTDAKDIGFNKIDKNFIRRYARWLKHTNISDSTQSFYLRNFRAVLNKAHKEGLIGDISGWFNEVNTTIYSQSGKIDDKFDRNLLLRIENLDLTEDKLQGLVRDMFMFGFYCGGLELIDVANLTNTNIKDGVLTFRRRLKGHSNNVLLGPSARKILSRYSGGGEYLFPLLDRFRGVLFNTVRNYVAKGMKDIGQLIGFPKITFGMNVLAYKSLVSSTNISELLLK